MDCRNVFSSLLPPIHLVFKSWNAGLSIFQDGIDRYSDMYYNVNRFDGHKQKLDRSLSFQTIDVAQCCTHVLQKLMTEAK